MDSVGKIEQVFPPENFVPIREITSYTAEGKKGQFSYGIAPFGGFTVPALWRCPANNTWVDFLDRMTIEGLLAGFVSFSDSVEQYVPISELENQDSVGIKGQFSVLGTRYFKCIATDTWIELTGATSFTV